MSLNGAGVYNVNSAGQPVVATTLITAAAFNAFTADIATALSTAIFKDGQQTVTANIPMAAFKITGLGAATARTDAASLAIIQDGTGVYVGTVGGTGDAITLTPSPVITAYATGQLFAFLASAANTTAVTVAISGLATKAITKNGSTALVANDIRSGMLVTIRYDGTQFILMTPGFPILVSNGGSGAATFTSNGVLIGNGTSAFTVTAEGATNTLLHGVTGADPSFSAVVEADITLADNTTNNATTTAHGFLKKLDNVSTNFMNGQGNWAAPSGTLTAGTALTLNPYAASTATSAAHGLGTAPSFLRIYIECLTGELGYAIGDRVELTSENMFNSAGFTVSSNATTVYVATSNDGAGSRISIIDQDTPAGAVAITYANWKLVVTPYKLN